jgi:hypothetical protein
MTILAQILLGVILLLLGLINYQIYIAFTKPENARREAFAQLSEEQITELKKQMTAEHFFKLKFDIDEPKEPTKKRK